MSGNGEGNGLFREHRMYIIEALKRHEDDQGKLAEANAKEHKEIMAKLSKLEVIVTANEREMKIRQGIWGGLGGAVIVALKILLESFSRGGP